MQLKLNGNSISNQKREENDLKGAQFLTEKQSDCKLGGLKDGKIV